MTLETSGRSVDVVQTPPPPAKANESCPKCGKDLIDPNGLGWCKDCGYCKSLADDNAKELLALKRAAGMAKAGGAITVLPLWFWVSLLFFAIGIFFSIVMDQRLPESGTLQRAMWATLQVLVGYVVVFLAQWSALVTIAPEEPSLSYKDSVLSFKLWVMIMKRLPELRECLWTALLGLSLMIGSVAFIGGFEHWFGYVPKTMTEREKELARTRKSGGGIPIVIPVE